MHEFYRSVKGDSILFPGVVLVIKKILTPEDIIQMKNIKLLKKDIFNISIYYVLCFISKNVWRIRLKHTLMEVIIKLFKN